MGSTIFTLCQLFCAFYSKMKQYSPHKMAKYALYAYHGGKKHTFLV